MNLQRRHAHVTNTHINKWHLASIPESPTSRCPLQLSPSRVTIILYFLKTDRSWTSEEWNHTISALFYLNSFAHTFERVILFLHVAMVFSFSMLCVLYDVYMIIYLFIFADRHLSTISVYWEWSFFEHNSFHVFDEHVHTFVLSV